MRVDRSSKYWRSSHDDWRHAKYVYDWLKPILARRSITRGRVNASARKMASGCSRRITPITHSQKANALVCGLSTRNVDTPAAIQKRITSASSSHRPRQSSLSKSSG